VQTHNGGEIGEKNYCHRRAVSDDSCKTLLKSQKPLELSMKGDRDRVTLSSGKWQLSETVCNENNINNETHAIFHAIQRFYLEFAESTRKLYSQISSNVSTLDTFKKRRHK
jgi:hypothetical protein